MAAVVDKARPALSDQLCAMNGFVKIPLTDMALRLPNQTIGH